MVENNLEDHSVSLNCRPGFTRPSDLIQGVLEGTGIKVNSDEPAYKSFGEWKWEFKVSENTWKIQKSVIYERIVKLYNGGCIRYGGYE